MVIETERLKIRDVALSDERAFSEMASDGSLNDVGFDRNCSSWMKGWIIEAQNLVQKDDPRAEFRDKGYALEAVKAYIRYYFEHYDENEMIATIREDNIPSWKVIEKAGFVLTEK